METGTEPDDENVRSGLRNGEQIIECKKANYDQYGRNQLVFMSTQCKYDKAWFLSFSIYYQNFIAHSAHSEFSLFPFQHGDYLPLKSFVLFFQSHRGRQKLWLFPIVNINENIPGRNCTILGI